MPEIANISTYLQFLLPHEVRPVLWATSQQGALACVLAAAAQQLGKR